MAGEGLRSRERGARAGPAVGAPRHMEAAAARGR